MKPQIHEVIKKNPLRPVMEHALLTKNHLVATDTNVLIVHDTEEVFPSSFVEQIKTEYLVHYTCLKEMSKKQTTNYYIENNQMIVENKKGETKTFNLLINEQDGLKYPNWQSAIPVLPDYIEEPKVGEIGVNPMLLNNLRMAIDPGCRATNLIFLGKTKPIWVEGISPKAEFNNYKAMIMPVLVI